MTKKREHPYRPTADFERLFVETRLEVGHSPKSILTTMNLLTQMSVEDIRKHVEGGRAEARGRATPFEAFSGHAPYNMEDVRRIYDRMRKSQTPADRQREDNRHAKLAEMGFEDSVNMAQPGSTWKRGQRRRMADAGFIFRLTADDEAMKQIEQVYGHRED